MEKNKISIITVVKNSETNIEKTILFNAEEPILDLKSRALEEIISYKDKE